MATLYIVATPIGNLEDITLRAIRILKEVDMVLCEDTRMTSKLLAHYEISKPLKSFNAHASEGRFDEIFEFLNQGMNIALVSDAGTPTISDPGSLLVQKVKQEVPDTKIIAIPGPSALVAALSVSGIPASEFTFLGFLPHKKGRETLFKEIATSERVMTFYESPHRIIKTLTSLQLHCPQKHIVIARELTKIFEETVSGTPGEVLGYFSNNEDKIRGEFVVIVSPHK
jgi:16S rRNA (cytidine1402-2'-O)-methyltransferase